jgi:hypothetical protein
MEIKIELDKRLLDDRDFDFFHYNETILLASCEYGKFYIKSCGELKCTYFDENGVCENALNTIQEYYIKNNKEFLKAIKNGDLLLDMNNWFEIDFISNDTRFASFNIFDEIFGSISDCVDCIEYVISSKEETEKIEKIILLGIKGDE